MPQLNLSILGTRLKGVDLEIMRLARKRMELALLVGASKQTTGDPIFRSEIEDDRIAEIRVFAESIDLSPNFAESMLYALIGESCKQQMIQLQSGDSVVQPQDAEERLKWCKKNLLELAKVVSATDHQLRFAEYPATADYAVYEGEVIQEVVSRVEVAGVAVDLGCGKGNIFPWLSPKFDVVRGYDISPDMIAAAQGQFPKGKFEVADLDEGIPLEDESASMIVMGLGSASNLSSAENLFREVQRVLRPGGRFVLSFHNSEALMYESSYVPVHNGWAAFIDVDEECLNVKVAGKTYRIHATPYSLQQIDDMVPKGLVIEGKNSYPVVSSLVPRVILKNTTVTKKISEIDRTLSDTNQGAYLLVTGKKE